MFLADTGALIDDTLWSQLQARMPIFRFASSVPTCCTRARGPRNPRESCECVQVSDTRAWCPSSVSLRSLLVQPTYMVSLSNQSSLSLSLSLSLTSTS